MRTGFRLWSSSISLLWVGALLLSLSPGLLASGGQAAEAPQEFATLPMVMGLFGGLSLFLFGMEQMTESLQAAAGEKMKDFLERLTSNRIFGVLTGAFVTAVIQSSSVTTVLVVGFISAGLMTLPQSIGVIMGANLGTTITGQIVAFKVTEAALGMVAVGYSLIFLSKRERWKQYGGMIMGLGLLFFGMGIMSDAMRPLRTYEPFIEAMAEMGNPILGIGVAALFTALIQSSSATTGIVIVMASQGLVTLKAGIALAMGANIGTCVTAVLAAIGKTPEAKRAATVHVLFNVLGVLVWIGLIPTLASFAQGISPSYPELQGLERLGKEVPRQIANANTLFNLGNTLIFLGFTHAFARIATWIIPDGPAVPSKHLAETRYLEEDLIDTPALALEMVRFELGHLGEVVQGMLSKIGPASLEKSTDLLEQIRLEEARVDLLRCEILDYLGRVRKLPLTSRQSRELQDLMNVTENLEYTADIISKDLVKLTYRAIDAGVASGESLRLILEGLFASVLEALTLAVRSVREDDEVVAEEVLAMKERMARLVRENLEFQATHLDVEDPNRIEVFRIEMETVDDLRRVYTLCRRMAKAQLPD